MSENTIPPNTGSAALLSAGTIPAARDSAAKDLAARIADQTLAKRGEEYASEVRRLLDAALRVIRQSGTRSRPRVADIVAAAGLSNEAFYRHFPSKDSLVAALLEDGTERLASYLIHQMGKEATPEGQVRRWVEGVLSQTRKEIAATTLAVLWNGGSVGGGGRHNASAPLGALLHQPFAALGSDDPEMAASLAAHATLGKVSDYLWAEQTPTRVEVDYVVAFCIGAATRRASAGR
jgi:AcrR family transcriptional regulator